MDIIALEKCVKKCIIDYEERLSNKLNEINIDNLLRSTNPYLLRFKMISGELSSVEQAVDYLIQTYKIESEQTIFGEFFEQIYYFLAESAGWELEIDPCESIDCVCTKTIKDVVEKKAVSIKSGPSWGNSDQIKKMIDNFNVIKQKHVGIECINMCSYGKDETPNKKHGYKKLCGQRGWYDISGDLNMYKKIMNAISCVSIDGVNNKYELVGDFKRKFCNKNDEIDWEKLFEYNSGSSRKYKNIKKFEVLKQQEKIFQTID